MTGVVGLKAPTPVDGWSIGHGGAIAVDTEQVRDVGARMRVLWSRFEEAHGAILRAQVLIASAPTAHTQVDLGALRRSGERVEELAAELDAACAGTTLMADAFEVIELRAQAEALALTDAAAADAIRSRIDRLIAEDQRIEVAAEWLVADAEEHRFDGLGDQYDIAGLLPPVFLSGAIVGMASGLGKVLPGATLKGDADPVRVTRAAPVEAVAAPTSLAGAFRRMPSGGAQVAIEKYAMPDGATRYVTYLTGTQSAAPWQAGETEPWDMKSNVELYTGQESSSYQATLEALAAAGAEPGDRVDVVAYSQSGMIAAHLAMESEFDVAMQITAGSPQEPTLGDDQTLIQLRHTDDVVSALAAGGSAAGTGSADSFTASRIGDPHDGWQDLALRPHSLEAYIETAEMVDASDDPRAEELDEYWDELGEAVEVERTEYRAERKE